MNIYVGNLSLEVTANELRQEFVAFGEVVSVTIMNDKYIGSGQQRGYGFVEMPSQSEGEAAMAALNGKILKHKTLHLIESLPLSADIGASLCSNKTEARFSRKIRQRENWNPSHGLHH
jgi:RNA recognition motif-containing protein